MSVTAASTIPSLQTPPQWKMSGHVILACNCDYGCPCNFNGLPTHGKCEGGWNWQILDGRFGDISLAGLNFSVFVKWPGAIHEGNGEAVIVIDERADARQREALNTLLAGQAGGPWQIVRTTLGKVHGTTYAPYEVKYDGFTSRVRVGDYATLEMAPVRNAVTGAEVHPRAVLPEGFIFKDGALASSATFRLEGPVSFDHSGRYAAAAPFEYQGP